MASQRLDTALKALIDIYGHDKVMERVRYLVPTKRVASEAVRTDDPDTSHDAAPDEQDVGQFTTRSCKFDLLRWFANHDGTDQQAALAVLPPDPPPSVFDHVRRRATELRKPGFTYDTGRRDHNLGTNKKALVSAISEEGRTALIWLETTGCSRPKNQTNPWSERHRNGHES
jgi:hypothetical protein